MPESLQYYKKQANLLGLELKISKSGSQESAQKMKATETAQNKNLRPYSRKSGD